MIKEHSSFVKQASALLDVAILTASFYLAHFLVSLYRQVHPPFFYWYMLVGFMGFYLYFAWTRSLFSVLNFTWMPHLLSRVFAIFVSAGVLGAAILYMLPDKYNSRTLYFIFALTSFFLIAPQKVFAKWFLGFIHKHNRNTTPIILFGRGKTAARVYKEILAHPQWGLRVVMTLDLSISPKEFERILKKNYVEEVYFCIPRVASREGFSIDAYLSTCEILGRPARVFINILGATRFARWEYHRFLDRPTLISHTVELDPDQLIFKRAFDVAGGFAGFFILCLIYPFLAIGIKLSSPGPIFFQQVRVGKNGKRFLIYKFRSMDTDAEDRKKELEKHNELSGAVFKMKDDPRVFPFGQFMRKTSLDELPQFINVLRGEMSLVGTRPPTPDEVQKYRNWHYRRISIKPGLTGMWQVSGRNQVTDFDEIVKLDLKYIDSWNLWKDIVIILKTVLVLLKRDSAF